MARAPPQTFVVTGLDFALLPVVLEEQRRYGKPAFVILLGVVFGLFIVTVGKTLPAVFIGALLAALSTPLRDRLTRRGWRQSSAAAIVTMTLVVGVLVPLTALVVAVAGRLLAVLQEVPRWIAEVDAPGGLAERMAARLHVPRLLPDGLGQQATALVAWAGRAIPGLLGNLLDVGLVAFLVLVTTYYLLRDGPSLLARVERVLPLEPRHVRALVLEFGRSGRAVFVGMAGTAAAQAAVGGLVYWVLGVPHPLLLGALTFVAALTPIVGTALVAVPVIGYLFLDGHPIRGFIALGAALAVSGLDNLVRPQLMGNGMRVHPLLLFLGIFGGLSLFGGTGMLLGPLFVSLFTAVGRIYAREMAPEAAGYVLAPVPERQTPLRRRIVRRLLGAHPLA